MNFMFKKLFNVAMFIASNGEGPAVADGINVGDVIATGLTSVWSFIAWAISGIWSLIGTTIMDIIYFIVRLALNLVDFLQFFVGKLIGVSTWETSNVGNVSLENSDIIFKFLMNDSVQKVFIALLVLSIVLLLVFTVISIVRQQYASVVDEKQDNNFWIFAKKLGRSLFLFLIVPIMVIFGILGSNAVLAGICSAFKLGSGITLGGQVFVASSYEANRFRTYADADQKFPMIYKNAVDVVDMDDCESDYVALNYKKSTMTLDEGFEIEVMSPYLVVTKDFNNNTILTDIEVRFNNDASGLPNEHFIFKGKSFLMSEDGFVSGSERTKYKINLNSSSDQYDAWDGEEGYYAELSKYFINVDEKNYLNGIEVKGSGENSYIIVDVVYEDEMMKDIPKSENAINSYDTWTFNNKYRNASFTFDSSRVITESDAFLLSNPEKHVTVITNAPSLSYMEYENFVTLKNEYYVMADIIDYALESGEKLYYVPISFAEKEFNGSGKDKLRLNEASKNTMCSIGSTKGFFVQYSNETDFYKFSTSTNELEGAVFVVCTYSPTSKKYIPLTQKNSGFSSSYLNPSYGGMIIARGILETSSIFSVGYAPTYMQTVDVVSASAHNVKYYSGINVAGKTFKFGSTVLTRALDATASDQIEDIPNVNVTLKAYGENGLALSSKDKTFSIDYYTQEEVDSNEYTIDGVNYKDIYFDCIFFGPMGLTSDLNEAKFKIVLVQRLKKVEGKWEQDAVDGSSYTIESYFFADSGWVDEYIGAATNNATASLVGGSVVGNEINYIYFQRETTDFDILSPVDLNISLINGRARWALFHGGSVKPEWNSVIYRLDSGAYVLDYNFNPNTGIAMAYLYNSIDLNVIVLVFATFLLFTVLVKAVWGLIDRIYQVVLLFIIMPGFVSTIPIDDGQRFGEWKKMLISKVLSTYGVAIGLNLFFILAPAIKSASQIFESGDVPSVLKHVAMFSDPIFLNRIVYIMFLLVALTLLQSAPGLIAKLIGAGDVVEDGGKVKGNVSSMVDDVRDTVSGQKAKKFMEDFKDNALGFVPGSAIWQPKFESYQKNKAAKKAKSLEDANREELNQVARDAGDEFDRDNPEEETVTPPPGGPGGGGTGGGSSDNPAGDGADIAEEPTGTGEPPVTEKGDIAEEPTETGNPAGDVGDIAEEPTETGEPTGDQILIDTIEIPNRPIEDSQGHSPEEVEKEKRILSTTKGVSVDDNKNQETSTSQDDIFKILGLGDDATTDDIKKALRERVKQVHSDAGGSDAQFVDFTKIIEELSGGKGKIADVTDESISNYKAKRNALNKENNSTSLVASEREGSVQNVQNAQTAGSAQTAQKPQTAGNAQNAQISKDGVDVMARITKLEGDNTKLKGDISELKADLRSRKREKAINDAIEAKKTEQAGRSDKENKKHVKDYKASKKEKARTEKMADGKTVLERSQTRTARKIDALEDKQINQQVGKNILARAATATHLRALKIKHGVVNFGVRAQTKAEHWGGAAFNAVHSAGGTVVNFARGKAAAVALGISSVTQSVGRSIGNATTNWINKHHTVKTVAHGVGNVVKGVGNVVKGVAHGAETIVTAPVKLVRAIKRHEQERADANTARLQAKRQKLLNTDDADLSAEQLHRKRMLQAKQANESGDSAGAQKITESTFTTSAVRNATREASQEIRTANRESFNQMMAEVGRHAKENNKVRQDRDAAVNQIHQSRDAAIEEVKRKIKEESEQAAYADFNKTISAAKIDQSYLAPGADTSKLSEHQQSELAYAKRKLESELEQASEVIKQRMKTELPLAKKAIESQANLDASVERSNTKKTLHDQNEISKKNRGSIGVADIESGVDALIDRQKTISEIEKQNKTGRKKKY